MPDVTFTGKGNSAVQVRTGGHSCEEFSIEDPKGWTGFLVNGRYRVYASRRGRRWEFMVSDPEMSSYVFAGVSGAQPPLSHKGKVTLRLPDDPPPVVAKMS